MRKQPMQNWSDDARRVAERHAVAGGGKDNGHPNPEMEVRKSKLEANSKFESRIRKQHFKVQCQLLFAVRFGTEIANMLKLGVNIDHVATVREARYKGRGWGEPDPVASALECEAAGAHGITAHLREDRRHIQDRDVWKLREVIKTRLNLEMANTPEIVGIALKLKPDIVCLVPERRQEITTEGGLDVAGNLAALTETRKKMNDGGIEVSLFIAPDGK